jgi:hypothetical protein
MGRWGEKTLFTFHFSLYALAHTPAITVHFLLLPIIKKELITFILLSTLESLLRED